MRRFSREARGYRRFQRAKTQRRMLVAEELAEREGFEPPIRLPVCRISSAVHSTALPPLREIEGPAKGAAGRYGAAYDIASGRLQLPNGGQVCVRRRPLALCGVRLVD